MRLASVSLFAAGLAALYPLGAFAAADSDREGEVVAVLDLATHLEADDAAAVDAPALADRVRAAAARALPEAQVIPRQDLIAVLPRLAEPGAACDGECATKAARDLGADVAVSGDIARTPQGLLLSLKLFEADDGALLSQASTTTATPAGLHEAIGDLTVELLTPLKSAPAAAAVVALGPLVLPEVPGPAGALQEGGAVALDVDAQVLVALDKARTMDAAGQERPDRAAAAWDLVAQLEGKNPFRELASARARKWQGYAENKRAFEAQHAKDRSRLRKVLPLKWVAEPIKQELLLRYARAYGNEKAAGLLTLLRSPQSRARAELALGCEAKSASSCVQLARIEDEGKRPQSAADFLGRACEVGSGDVCAEAGARFLSPPTKDEARAQALLQRGCTLRKAAACARLAAYYEDAEAKKQKPSMAAQLRARACDAGDGKSCRKLACAAEGDGAAKALWEKGCAAGDSPSCALAGKSAQAELSIIAAKTQLPLRPAENNPAMRQQEVAPAATAKPAGAAATTAEGSRNSKAGMVLVGVGLATAGGIAFMALAHHDDGGDGYRRFPRSALAAAPDSSSGARTALLYGMSAAAAVSTGLGAYLLLTRPAADKPQAGLSLAPNGVLLSGTLP